MIPLIWSDFNQLLHTYLSPYLFKSRRNLDHWVSYFSFEQLKTYGLIRYGRGKDIRLNVNKFLEHCCGMSLSNNKKAKTVISILTVNMINSFHPEARLSQQLSSAPERARKAVDPDHIFLK